MGGGAGEGNPRPLSARFAEAFAFAARLHAGQARKGTDIPYVSHLMAVCAIVLENGGFEDAAIAALLHDAAEDQGGAAVLDEIGRRFGPAVRSVVESCTDTTETPKPAWRRRKEKYVAHLAGASGDALLVSLADKVHNARSILREYQDAGEAVWDKFKGGREGTLWYYSALAKAFEERGAHRRLAAELRGIVDNLARLAARGREAESR